MNVSKRPSEEWLDEVFNDEIRLGFKIGDRLYSAESSYQSIEIVETKSHGRLLLNDGKTMVSERDEFIYHEMMAHVPLFLHKNAKRVLVIGGGDGGTVREVLRHQEVRECWLVEIDPLVIESCQKYLPLTAQCLSDPRVKVRCEDGVEFVKKCPTTFDLILIDSTDPIGPAAPLFGDEFYRNVRRCLTKGGIVVAQAESPFYQLEMQKKLTEILASHFTKVHLYNFTNMTYPGGLWSFGFASDHYSPLRDLEDSRVAQSQLDFKWYSPEVHRASFALPAFQKKMLFQTLSPLEE